MRDQDRVLEQIPAEIQSATGLTEKYKVTIEYLMDLSKYLNLKQIDSLLDSIGSAAGSKKLPAYTALPGAVKALQEINPDSERTAFLLRWVAEVSQDDAADAYDELSNPVAARALQEMVSAQGISLP